MNNSFVRPQTVERFRPDPDRLYDVDMTARLAGVPRRSVLIYCRWGFVRPATDPEYEGWYFDSGAISTIRWAEYLRVSRSVNLPGIRVISNSWSNSTAHTRSTGDGSFHGEKLSPRSEVATSYSQTSPPMRRL